jgi:hypothetical protein
MQVAYEGGESYFDFCQDQEISLPSKPSRPALGHTHPPLLGTRSSFAGDVLAGVCKAAHSSAFSAYVRNEQSCIHSSICFYGM